MAFPSAHIQQYISACATHNFLFLPGARSCYLLCCLASTFALFSVILCLIMSASIPYYFSYFCVTLKKKKKREEFAIS